MDDDQLKAIFHEQATWNQHASTDLKTSKKQNKEKDAIRSKFLFMVDDEVVPVNSVLMEKILKMQRMAFKSLKEAGEFPGTWQRGASIATIQYHANLLKSE